MIIDTHNHVRWLGYNPERIVENMEEHDIDKTWLLSWEVPRDEVDLAFYMSKFHPSEIGMPFDGVLETVSRFPDQFIPGYCPDPRKPDSVDRLEAAVNNLGVKVCGELKLRMMFDNLDAIRMYNLCARYKLPVVVHIDYPVPSGTGNYPRPDYWYGGGIEPFERALKKCPETIFLGHGPGFWAHISKDDKYLDAYYPEGPVVPGGTVVRLLNDCSNLYGDLSANSARNALSRDMGFGKEFILEFQDRLLFARDSFSGDLFKLLMDFALPEEVLEKIVYKNAVKLVPAD